MSKKSKSYRTFEIQVGEHTVLISECDLWIKEVFPTWYIRKGYVSCERWIETEYGSVNQKIYLHRLVVGAKNKSWQVDHANRNKLDNRRENLRMATASENMANTISKRKSNSGYRGVYHYKNLITKPFLVTAKSKNLGRYATAVEAARVYDRYALETYGAFAVLNFPEEHGREANE